MAGGVAYGGASIAMGYAEAIGEGSTAMSLGIAYGNYSTAMNFGVTYSEYSTAMSGGSTSGAYSTAMSEGSTSGAYSTAMSEGATSGIASIAGGFGINTVAFRCAAFGSFNVFDYNESPTTWVETDPIFVVGNGTGDHADPPEIRERNAFVIRKNGNIEMMAKVRMPRQGDILMGEFGESEPLSFPIIHEALPWHSARGDRLTLRPIRIRL